MNRKEILNKVANYICYKKGIKTNKELARLLGISATSFASAINGNEKYMTDTLMMRIGSLFPELNTTYLLKGEGDMMRDNEESATPGESGASLAERYLKVIESQQEMLKAQQESITKLVDKVTGEVMTKKGMEKVS